MRNKSEVGQIALHDYLSCLFFNMSNDESLSGSFSAVTSAPNTYGGKRLEYLVSCGTPQPVLTHSSNTSSVYTSEVAKKLAVTESQNCSTEDVIESPSQQVRHISQSCGAAASSPKTNVISIHVAETLVPVCSKGLQLVHQIKPLSAMFLCEHCGICSLNPTVCSYCHRPVKKNLPTQENNRLRSSSTVNGQNIRNLRSSNFYNKNGLCDFQRYLAVGRGRKTLRIRRSAPQKSPECITIDDSSDDEQPQIVSCSGSESANPIGTLVKRSGYKYVTEVNVKSPRVDPGFQFFFVHVDCIRIGDTKYVPSGTLQMSKDDISMPLPETLFRVKWFWVTRVELSPVEKRPCIFLYLSDDCLGAFRSSLQMVPGQSPYFNPRGPIKQRHIILYLSPDWFRTKVGPLRVRLRDMMDILKKPKSFFEEITICKANNLHLELANADQRVSEASNSASGDVYATVTSLPPLTRRPYETRIQTKPTPAQETADVDEVKPCFVGPRVQLAIYPAPPSTGGISITTEDLFCLNEGEFLNDVIVDFYLKYTMQELVSPEIRERCHVFSCFFYKRLTNTAKGVAAHHEDKTLSMEKRRHARVRKWTRNVDLFSKDFIFIPINDQSHWYLAVICFPGQEPAICELPLSSNQDLTVTDVRSLGGATAELSQSLKVAIEEDSLPPLAIENVNNVQSPGGATPNHVAHVEDKNDVLTTTKSSQSPDVDIENVSLPSSMVENLNNVLPPEGANPNQLIHVVDDVLPPHVIVKDADAKTNNVFQIQCINNELSTDVEMKEIDPLENENHSTSKGAVTVVVQSGENGDTASEQMCSNQNEKDTLAQNQFYRNPCILIFDSLRSVCRSRTATVLREYLNEEWQQRKSAEFGEKVFDSSSMRMNSPVVPQQDNYSDCGVFLLHYVEMMFHKPIQSFSVPIKSLQNWFDPADAKAKRAIIRDVIENLRQMQSSS